MKHNQKLHSVDTHKKMSIIVSRINRLRVEQKIPQRVLAVKAKVAYITIAKVESGEQFYSMPSLIKIAQALNISLSDLFKDI